MGTTTSVVGIKLQPGEMHVKLTYQLLQIMETLVPCIKHMQAHIRT